MPHVEQLAEGVYAVEAQFEDVPLKVYVILGDTVAVIDPGVAYTPETALAPGLRELGLSLSDVKVLINTHGHHDHFGGNGAVKQHSPDVTLYAHESDAAWIGDVDLYLTESHDVLAPDWHPSEAFSERIRGLSGTPFPVDEYLVDGEVLDLGRGHRLTIRHIPAHTDGSVALFHEAGKVLFTGDALQGLGTPHLRQPDFYPNYNSVTEYERSLDYFAECGAAFVGTAHNNVCSAHRAAQIIAESRTNIAELEHFLLEQLRATGSLSRTEAVQAVIDGSPRYRVGPAAMRSVTAQLAALEERGEIVRRTDEESPRYQLAT
jgi:glyoxylase-like metal-dependent hydrolase (beta-lactamase superfamily II)